MNGLSFIKMLFVKWSASLLSSKTRVVNIAIQVSLSLVSAIHLEYRHEYCQYFLQQVSLTVSPILFQPKLRY